MPVLLLHTTAVWTFDSALPERSELSSGRAIKTRSITREAASRPQFVEKAKPVESAATRPAATSVATSSMADVDAAGAKDAQLENATLDLSTYLPIDSVDAPAVPQGDWRVDQNVLQALEMQRSPENASLRLVIEIYVDERGAVRQCALEEPADLDVELAHGLEKALCGTPMSPALQGGRPIGSVRRIEMVVGQ